jgi:hypothetical protein
VGATHPTEAYREKEQPVSAPTEAAGVTWRATAISLAIILLSVPAIFYGEVVWPKMVVWGWLGAGWSSGVPASWPLSVLFLLGAVGSLPLLRRFALRRRELLTVYTVVLVATPVLGAGVLFFVFSTVVSYYYYARVLTNWEVFLPFIPIWFGPSSSSAVEGYFAGGVAVPWAEWARPLAAWSSFMICLFGARVCLLVLVQKQWIRNERLTMPLAEIPLGMIEESGRTGTGRLPRNALFWLGLVFAAFLGFQAELTTRLPWVPSLPMSVTIMQRQVVGPFSVLGDLRLLLAPWLLALAYLMPAQLSFSVWFFWLVKTAMAMLAVIFGASPGPVDEWWGHDFPAPFDQQTGAVLVFSGWVLWRARGHLTRALRIAFTRQRRESDADEPISYRWTFASLLVCFLWMAAFLVLAGCRPVFALLYVPLLVGVAFSCTRISAETAFDPNIWFLHGIVPMATGTRALRPREIVSLVATGWAHSPFPRQVISACSMNALLSFKIGDAAGVPLRRLTRVLLLGFLVALGVGLVYVLHAVYRIGFNSTFVGSTGLFPGWYFGLAGETIFEDLTDPQGPEWNGVVWWGVGAAVFVFLAAMRLRFLWWPFHPVGYVLGFGLMAGEFIGGLPFVVAWLAKALVLRYGGLRLYRETLPVAIGLIVGDVLNRSLWNIISLVSHGHY